MKGNFGPESSGWYSRGYIPHFDQPDLIQLITFRLNDAVPRELVKQWKTELAWVEKLSARDPRQAVLRKRIDKYEDAGYGACWLRENKIAAIVQSTILHFDGERYRILAWCIMPNHVHVVVEIWEKSHLPVILHSWKSYSAHEANWLLNRSGIFWFPEYHDRFVRNSEHLAASMAYVEGNPVKAGLVRTKEEWQWGSAWERGRSRPQSVRIKQAAGTAALPAA
ncbi:MAG: transposase [Acidobacteriota bacterium]|jgi:REP element-mobilizing transposase RayT